MIEFPAAAGALSTVAIVLVLRALRFTPAIRPPTLIKEPASTARSCGCLLAVAALVWAVFGWKAAAAPLALAILAGMAATIVWSASAELESHEPRFWE